jgi:hypothetical protein
MVCAWTHDWVRLNLLAARVAFILHAQRYALRGRPLNLIKARFD